MPERFRAGHDDHVRRFAATGTTSRRMGDGTVLYGLRASGEEFPMEASISQLDTGEGKLFTVILRDITERVRAQEELSQPSRRRPTPSAKARRAGSRASCTTSWRSR